MPLTRTQDWPEKLAAFVEERRNAPFNWGTNDCCLFACDAVRAMTGADLAAEYRGKYSAALGAMRLIQPFGGAEGAFERSLAAVNDAPAETRTISFIQRGDVVSTRTKHGAALGVYLGGIAAFPGRNGITFLSLTQCSGGWKI